MDPKNPPILLTYASGHGTLAAVRCLGRAGIPVTVADHGRLRPAAWSRFATRHVWCPPLEDADAFVDWLDAFSRENPEHVLCPTSDSTAWIYAVHRDRLASRFRLRVPPAECVYALLNKRKLHDAARAVGLDTPRTLYPRDAGELEKLLPELPYPVLVKPQTQVLLHGGNKGRRARDAAEARAQWAAFEASERYGAALVARDPAVATPIIQELLDYREAAMVSVAGFVSAGGERMAVLGSTKRLQRPRRIGIGVCFESTPVPPALSAGLKALCRAVGYHGVFEAEFVRVNGRDLLIDFNPRFYGQMAFEIARGLPLPLLAYHEAVEMNGSLAAQLDAVPAEVAPDAPRAYAHRLGAALVLAGLRAGRRMERDEARRWRSFFLAHRGRIVDAVQDRDDPVPAVLAWVTEALGWMRHPRSFVRTHVWDE